jgi:hypothetical protein
MSVYEDIELLVRNEVWHRKRDYLPPLTRLILGVEKRRQLIRSVPPNVWVSRFISSSKKETFMGLEILVDFGDPERVSME